LGYAQRHDPKQTRSPWSSLTVRTQLDGQCQSAGGHTRSPSSATS
jgi:hypothetical protein